MSPTRWLGASTLDSVNSLPKTNPCCHWFDQPSTTNKQSVRVDVNYKLQARFEVATTKLEARKPKASFNMILAYRPGPEYGGSKGITVLPVLVQHC